jgi:hypothetical protein
MPGEIGDGTPTLAVRRHPFSFALSGRHCTAHEYKISDTLGFDTADLKDAETLLDELAG